MATWHFKLVMFWSG